MVESCYAYAEVPANGRDQPLVFAFHGTGGDETHLIPLAQRVWPDATVIAPRGDVSEHGALRFFKRKGEGTSRISSCGRRLWPHSSAPRKTASRRPARSAWATRTAPTFSPRLRLRHPTCSTRSSSCIRSFRGRRRISRVSPKQPSSSRLDVAIRSVLRRRPWPSRATSTPRRGHDRQMARRRARAASQRG